MPFRTVTRNTTTSDNAILDAARGEREGWNPVFKFGYNADVDATEEPLWSGGTSYNGWLSAAGTVSAVSGSAADAAAGTGARKVRIFGLDSNWAAATEEITLDGTTPVPGTVSWLRIFRAYVSESGSGEVNAGLITFSVGANTMARIEIGAGQTQMLIYAVAAGSTLYYERLEVQVNSNSPADINFYGRFDLDGTPTVRNLGRYYGVSGPVEFNFQYGTAVEGPADVWVAASGGNNSEVSGQAVGIEIVGG